MQIAGLEFTAHMRACDSDLSHICSRQSRGDFFSSHSARGLRDDHTISRLPQFRCARCGLSFGKQTIRDLSLIQLEIEPELLVLERTDDQPSELHVDFDGSRAELIGPPDNRLECPKRLEQSSRPLVPGRRDCCERGEDTGFESEKSCNVFLFKAAAWLMQKQVLRVGSNLCSQPLPQQVLQADKLLASLHLSV